METIELLRGIFNNVLTPAAVVGVLGILVFNISRIIRKGFEEDRREGSQRFSAAVLPFAVLLYATVRNSATGSPGFLQLDDWIRGVAPWQLFLGSVGAGVALAAQVFYHEPEQRLLMRMMALIQSSIACFIGYIFIGVASAPGIDVAMGVLSGFCGYSIFPNRDSVRWQRDQGDETEQDAAGEPGRDGGSPVLKRPARSA